MIIMVIGVIVGFGESIICCFIVNGYKVIVIGCCEECLKMLKDELGDNFYIV